MIRRFTYLAVLVLALPSFVSASVVFVGAPVTLSDLVSGDTITVGDKVFADFTYLATGDVPAADFVNVQGIIDCDGNYGIRFQGAFNDLPGGGGSDALIGFKVSVAAGAPYLINDVHLAGNPDVLGGIGLASVTETFVPTGNPTLSIFSDGTNMVQTDWADLNEPVMMLQVQKDINLVAGAGSSGATLSFVDQTFSQILIPEPSTGLMLAMVALSLLTVRRQS